MAAAVGETGQRRWQGLGMGALLPEQALYALDRLLRRPGAQAAVLPLARLSADSPARSLLQERPLLRRLVEQLTAASPIPKNCRPRAGGQSLDNGRAPATFRDKLAQVPAWRRKPLLAVYLREQLGQVMGWEADYEIDPQQGLFDVGLDSLMAMELKHKLERNLGLARPLPFTLIFDYPTLASLIDYLHDEMMGVEAAAMAGAGDDLESLSAEELLALLAQEMDEK
jgi:aryl carrier-like protein